MKRLFIVLMFFFVLVESCLANSGIKFMVDQYYFELSYGKSYEFYKEERLSDSHVWKLRFKSILRIELPPEGEEYVCFKIPKYTEKTKSEWNPSHTLLLVKFGEHAIIMTPRYHILKCYRNTMNVTWKTDREFIADVETSVPQLYSAECFIINIEDETVNPKE
ncbi:hypothetical protein KAX29_06640 [candidate division WOR-3 bacterium]|nr:hypothetical protein [candidate division WOR-3 bacterium]